MEGAVESDAVAVPLSVHDGPQQWVFRSHILLGLQINAQQANKKHWTVILIQM